ncbi:MAG: hypothetical protein ABSA64_07280 [Sedimentisphaerales bacterium]|jgi:hypothetical protein
MRRKTALTIGPEKGNILSFVLNRKIVSAKVNMHRGARRDRKEKYIKKLCVLSDLCGKNY